MHALGDTVTEGIGDSVVLGVQNIDLSTQRFQEMLALLVLLLMSHLIDTQVQP
jgi:hypothetical protein